MSEQTKGAKKKLRICQLVSFILNFGPVIYFVAKAFIDGEATTKFTIGGIAMLVICLTLVMTLFKFKLSRTIFWLLLAASFICIKNVQAALIIMAVCNVGDEVIVEPLIKHYKNSYGTNKIIDTRLN